ncbi:hypothetical protein FRZ06_06430 [Anoxybacterium hadale]|uniref:Uncharacterized protein n=1 Tax=Anoxybacterium hadale TaxID=3408580 RepID=A0ACD1A976_9FIRM|nr:hypothetical protein FRZ06_06430 [Clostridiales bacterium]
MKKTDYEKQVSLILISAAVYFLLDLPVRMTGFLDFGAYIGIKNFLPVTLGLLFGWCGTIGCLIGSMLASVITAATLPELLFEQSCILVTGMGMWLLWHAGVIPHRVQLKKKADYFRYIWLNAFLAAVCGAISFVFLSVGAFLTVLIAYLSMNLLVGIPIIILMTSIICVIPVLPPWAHILPDVSGSVDSEPGSLDNFNDLLEEYFLLRKINRKNLYGIQNCIEEVMIRIFAEQPDTSVAIQFYENDSFSLWFTYQGSRYNPFVAGKEEASEDMFGLQLIKYRALRASYKYRRGINKIHIVI